ncbi:unnamed protein product [Candidula unifasciata]|uniref:Uncharacterized protein n=1 Tax=Candidula unifasciata TaxID=100452 RepID=A0A8S3YT42_9EUPU|nr:unnamed protein product [Candidula unifasciata]
MIRETGVPLCVTHDLDLLTLLEDKLKEYWKLGRALKEKYRKESENLVVVVVSHPHGGPKRISVGEAKVKDSALEVREDQDWCYYSYDAVTCEGSSGAPVYVLGRWNDGFGYWFGHSHNHSGIDSCNCSRSTVGVDSTFGQLKPPSSINFNDSVIQSATATNRSPVTMIKHIDDAASGSRLANDDTVYDENNNALKANTHTQSLVSFSQSRSNGIKKVTFEVMFGKLCYI